MDCTSLSLLVVTVCEHTFGAFSLEPVHRIQHCTTSHGRPTEAAPRRARLPEPPGPADGNASGRNDPTGRTPLKPIVFGRWRGHLHTWEKRSRSERGGAGVGGGWRMGVPRRGGLARTCSIQVKSQADVVTQERIRDRSPLKLRSRVC